MNPAGKPLAVDIDDSLLKTDMLLESLLAGFSIAPVTTLKVFWKNRRDKAALKAEMAEISNLDVSRLPVNEDVLAYARAARADGREVVLASGSDRALVDRLARRLDLEGDHIASDGTTNMTGGQKAEALVARYGDKGFDYIGNERTDLKVWEAGDTAIAVAPNPRTRRALASLRPNAIYLGERYRFASIVKALRPHQWVKNILLLLPVIAAHRASFFGFDQILLGMIAFSFAASSIYIVNDLLDLDADRQHEKKHTRPFAAGTVPIRVGIAASFVLGVTALVASLIIDWKMFGLVAVYMSLSLAYSIYLKRLRWIDIWVLAILYTLRVVAGAVAGSVAASGWLIAFVFPVFMALGCVKRMTEVARAKDDNRVPGRAYSKLDRNDLLNMSVLSAVNANIIFLTYTYSPTADQLYAGIWELRWVVLPVSAWLYRMISTGYAGAQNYDPIVFALRDRLGLVLLVVTVLGLYNAAAWAT